MMLDRRKNKMRDKDYEVALKGLYEQSLPQRLNKWEYCVPSDLSGTMEVSEILRSLRLSGDRAYASMEKFLDAYARTLVNAQLDKPISDPAADRRIMVDWLKKHPMTYQFIESKGKKGNDYCLELITLYDEAFYGGQARLYSGELFCSTVSLRVVTDDSGAPIKADVFHTDSKSLTPLGIYRCIKETREGEWFRRHDFIKDVLFSVKVAELLSEDSLGSDGDYGSTIDALRDMKRSLEKRMALEEAARRALKDGPDCFVHLATLVKAINDGIAALGSKGRIMELLKKLKEEWMRSDSDASAIALGDKDV